MIAITGGKGGCGKTTVVLGLGAALVRAGRRPLLVDADVTMPDLHIRAGVAREPGLAALGSGAVPERVAQRSTAVPGVDVVAAGRTSTVPSTAIEALSEPVRPVLVDCPAGAGPDVAAPLRAADACILVTTADPEGHQDAVKSATMADSVRTPIVATVRRHTSVVRPESRQDPTTGSAEPPSNAHGRGQTITLPTVEGDPLTDERISERLTTVVRALWADEHERPENLI